LKRKEINLTLLTYTIKHNRSEGNLYTFGTRPASGHAKASEEGDEEEEDADEESDDNVVSIPTKVEAFAKYDVIAASLGGSHSCVITGKGKQDYLWCLRVIQLIDISRFRRA